MAKRLTQKEYEQKVFDCVGNKYTVISEYKGRNQPITLKCNQHEVTFTCSADCFMRGAADIRSSCPECTKEKRLNSRLLLICDYCGKQFSRSPSKIQNSKSGLQFCCRECKDAAQRLENNFQALWPSHYGNGKQIHYRARAFQEYEHKCTNCGWNEDADILEVHHIDENRENNDLKNLMILCPICHRKLTSHKYVLFNKKIVKIDALPQ